MTGYAYKSLGAELSNWGRWGEDDERGTLNLLTPDRVRAAADRIVDGQVIELSVPLGSEGPIIRTGGTGRVSPVHLMNVLPDDLPAPDGAFVTDDYMILPLQAGTQWDGLAHVGYDGHFYNGVPASAVHARGGALRNGIQAALPGIVGRGVLLDAARHAGVDWLDASVTIGSDDLDRIAESQGVQILPGDILLVRTGWRRKALVDGWDGWLTRAPGLALECARWLHDHEIAAVASDNPGIERQPADGAFLPLHCVLIRDMGMMLGEIFDLEALSAECVRTGRWEFFFSAPPLRIPGAVGSPISPVAIL